MNDKDEKPPLDREEAFHKGVELFNQGNYHEGHEFWEDIWREEPHPERLFFQGLIQICAALLHLSWNHRRGSGNHVQRATEKLNKFTPTHMGIDVESLLAQIANMFDPGNVEKYLGRELGPDEAPKISYVPSSERASDRK